MTIHPTIEGGHIPDGAAPVHPSEDTADRGAPEVAADPIPDLDVASPEAGTDPPAELGAPSLRAAIEAVLFVVDTPIDAVGLAQACQRPEADIRACLAELVAEYAEAGRGITLREVAGGWRFYTHADCAGVLERFVRDGQQARLTQAALETLAVVAYRQPVSRSRVSAVRGVNVDGVMRTLLTRGLVEEAGAEPDSGATLYRTTSYFLERLGLRDLAELPPLAPMLPELSSLDDALEEFVDS